MLWWTVYLIAQNKGIHNHNSIATQETNGYNQSTGSGMSGQCIKISSKKNRDKRVENTVGLKK